MRRAQIQVLDDAIAIAKTRDKKNQKTSIGLGYNSVAEVPYSRVTSSRTVRLPPQPPKLPPRYFKVPGRAPLTDEGTCCCSARKIANRRLMALS
jgi:hypothetical protein